MTSKDYEDSDVLCSETLMLPTIKMSKDPGFILGFYKTRYWMVRALTCHVTFLPEWATKGKSLLEILFIFATAAIVVCMSQAHLTSLTSGLLAEDFACFMIILALRNNIMTMLLGISYERAIQYHKAAGVIAVLLGISHMIHNLRKDPKRLEKPGIAMLCLFVVTSFAYLLKERFFEVFYYFHISCYICILGVSWKHGARSIIWTVIVWGLDILFRYYFGAHRVEADVTLLSDDVMKISFKKAFDYSPGQYCFLAVPALSHFQYHPFSISSAPHEPLVTFHVRAVGNWTKQLLDLAISKGNKEEDAMAGEAADGTTVVKKIKIALNIEGPYGIPSIDLASGVYTVFLLIGGGIGVTPIQSIYNHLSHKYSNNPLFLKNCSLVWSVKDQSMIHNFEDSFEFRNEAPKMLPMKKNPAEKAKKIQVLEPGSLTDIENSEPPADDNANNVGIRDDVFSHSFHITTIDPKDKYSGNNDTMKRSKYELKHGRPDLQGIFTDLATICDLKDVRRVAVVACGPLNLVEQVTHLCSKRIKGVTFDLHKETFEI